MCGQEPCLDRAKILRLQGETRRDLRVRAEDLGRRGCRAQPGRSRPREEPRNELRPIRRQLEERLVQQVEIEIAATDVDDEGHGGTQSGDVGKVLFGADAHIRTARYGALHERRHDRLEPGFVRDQVFGVERAVRLGEIRHEFPEGLIGQPDWQLLGRDRRAGHRHATTDDSHQEQTCEQQREATSRHDISQG